MAVRIHATEKVLYMTFREGKLVETPTSSLKATRRRSRPAWPPTSRLVISAASGERFCSGLEFLLQQLCAGSGALERRPKSSRRLPSHRSKRIPDAKNT